MKVTEVLKRLGAPGVFDIAKTLHYHFPKVPTDRINNLILQLDSVDKAIIVLFANKEDNLDIDDAVCMILKCQDEKK